MIWRQVQPARILQACASQSDPEPLLSLWKNLQLYPVKGQIKNEVIKI